ncbi:chemotaxis protein CheW [Pleurocapsa sp. CCALA 161]|uniref:chemotaxis protein CheW n=1 Tax=Pleurocapsa sp. CCALA 161 TaxID=2107688 RepID=UPI000D06CBED|nr:chemotaxis protein CheW [Pleurocapsa sp. CCALA 161]PSB08939.1 chemotaxis protein CheW [Pleurocapsa sp. CCALA 161]
MGIKPYLIFILHDSRYAIAAESVSEIFLLPELTPVPEAPSDIVGLLNLHSAYVPVMHLDLRFGHKFDRCQITDSVIVVESQGLQVGMIVHRVETVNEIDDRYIQADLSYGRANIHQAFVQSIISLDDEMITLLNIDNLVRHPEALEDLVSAEANADRELLPGNFYEQYFTNASSNLKAALHQRAFNLKDATDKTAATKLISLAVVSIGGRYFALDLGVVREFTTIGRITTIPCCPEHIIGNINLRGEILTLVNICQSLNLTMAQENRAAKAVVVEVDEITAGIVVDEVFDVVDFSPQELKPVPVAMDSDASSYLKGVADYQNQTLNVIDLPKLLATGAMTVELTA